MKKSHLGGDNISIMAWSFYDVDYNYKHVMHGSFDSYPLPLYRPKT